MRATVTHPKVQEALDRSVGPLEDDDVFAGIPGIQIDRLEASEDDWIRAAVWRDLMRSDPMAGPDRLDHEDRAYKP